MSGNNVQASWMAHLTFIPQQSFIPKAMPLFGTVLLPTMTRKLDRETYLYALREKLHAMESAVPGTLALITNSLEIPDLPAQTNDLIGHPDFRAFLQPITLELPAEPQNHIPTEQKLLDLDHLLLEISA